MRMPVNLSKKRWLATAVPLAALGAAAWSYLDTKQRELIFAPVKQEAVSAPDFALDHSETWIPHASAALHALWAPARDAAAPIALFLHGARWNLSWHTRRIALWQRMGFSVLAIDYRGFGKSAGGLPTEVSVYEDAQHAWRYLQQAHPGATAKFVYGHSLGGAVAIELARTNDDLRGVIVESSFTSIRDMAKVMAHRWRWLPVDALLTQRFDSIGKVGDITAPLLLMHGKEDQVVPYDMSRRLYQATRQPKRLALFERAGHSDVSLSDPDRYRLAVREFAERYA